MLHTKLILTRGGVDAKAPYNFPAAAELGGGQWHTAIYFTVSAMQFFFGSYLWMLVCLIIFQVLFIRFFEEAFSYTCFIRCLFQMDI